MKADFPHLFIFFILSVTMASCPSGPAPLPHDGTTVNQALYDRTFKEILAFIKEMDEIIAAKDFLRWQARCTTEYLALNSDPARLKALSEKPNLKDNRIVLRSLEDYFIYVFVPSRVRTPLDTIEFVGSNKVKAVTVIDGRPYIVYFLEKVHNEWKIGVW